MRKVTRGGWIAGALAIATFALYARTMTFDFVNIDDPLQITANEIVKRGLTGAGIKYAFTTVDDGNYMPLVWLSHLVTIEICGLAPGAHHAVNSVLHAINVAVLFLFLQRTTGSTWRSAIVASLFGWHPLRVESVAWISERKDVLSGAFWMISLLLYLHYARRPTAVRYTALFVVFALGLLSKSMLVTLPCVLLLLDIWPLGRARLTEPRRLARLAMEKVPLLALSAAAAAAVFIGQRTVGALNDVETWTVAQRVTGSLSAYGAYLTSTFWPWKLAVFYPMPVEGVNRVGAIVGGVVVVLLTSAAVAQWKTRPYFATGWFWFVGTLVPVIGLVQVGGQSHADRYTYLPHIGLLIAIVWGMNEVMSRRAGWARLRVPVAAAACAACALISWRQIGFWRNSETLFAHTLEVTRDNWFAEGNYAVALMNRGAFDEAEPHLRSAIAIGPARYTDHLNLGFLLSSTGRDADAAEALEVAVELNPERAAPWLLLGAARLGTGDADGAISAYEHGLALDPTDANGRANLGVAYGMTGDLDAARLQFERVLVRWPKHADALYNYGVMEARRGDTSRAREHLEQLVAAHPERGDGWYALAALDAIEGQTDAAVEKLRRAIAQNAKYGDEWKADSSFDALRRAGLQP